MESQTEIPVKYPVTLLLLCNLKITIQTIHINIWEIKIIIN